MKVVDTMINYLKLARVKHYIKNILIFFPVFFAGSFFNLNLFCNTLYGFFSFSFLSSAIYVFNDLCDIKSDKEHDIKKNRPLAKGVISPRNAKIFIFILLALSLIFNFIAAKSNLGSWLVITIFFLANLFYSLKLKNIPILDIAILVSGFFLRLLYGSLLTNIQISSWLYLTVISLSFYLVLGKRRNEFSKQKGNTRLVLKYYNKEFLDKNMYMMLGIAITFYSLWASSTLTIERVSNNNLIFTVPILILICMKYNLQIEQDSNGDPVDVLFGDNILLGLVIFFGVITFLAIYL